MKMQPGKFRVNLKNTNNIVRILLMLPGFTIPLFSKSQDKNFSKFPVYAGSDLGLTYQSDQSVFRIWSPMASAVQLHLYADGEGSDVQEVFEMKKSDAGTWTALVTGDHFGKFYSFRTRIGRKWMNEVPDPYVKCVGINGKRGMVADPQQANPDGWESDKGPLLASPTDAIIYEMHIRDASASASSGIRQKGKYAGLSERNTVNNEGLSTGLDHILELGVTHVHLLPFFDFYSVDESKDDPPQYNWGYDPLNYNTPEGSYSTQPKDGLNRIRELKQMIKSFHDAGLGVVMDVVYNHTGPTAESAFNQLVPGYYYRHNRDGKLSNATACGNETASERPMMRKFMIESLEYWLREYHIDGFRFDLMGVHDLETMNIISTRLREIRPDILLYGEGWTAGSSPLPDSMRALKKFAYKLDQVAVFSDDFRDGLKGNVFRAEENGFISGHKGMEETIKFGMVASCYHPQVDYQKVNYSKAPYSKNPSQTISYVDCHDNHTLWDKLAVSAAGADPQQRKEMHKLALGLVLTSQGIPFLHAGTEFLRSKLGHENSFNAGDSINAIDWALKSINKDVFELVKSLIRMRKEHPVFRMTTQEELASLLRFQDGMPGGVVAYTLDGAVPGDRWSKTELYFNGNSQSVSIGPGPGPWKIFIQNNRVMEGIALGDKLDLQPHSFSILYQE